MVKPVESKSPHRPLKQESVGREVTLKATISAPGSKTTALKLDYWTITLPNDLLRKITGEDDL